MKKKKGYALILSVVVISLILILASSVLQLSVSAYKSTKKVEANNELKLGAESGIDKGLLILNKYILTKTNEVTEENPSPFNYLTFHPSDINDLFKSDLNYEDNGVEYTVEFYPKEDKDSDGNDVDVVQPVIKDAGTNRNITYIQIKATATKNSISKVLVATLDKAALRNVYFNQIFGTTFTTADIINSGTTSVNIEDNAILDITGNVFFQGGEVKLFPTNNTNFNYGEGRILVNSNTLTTSINSLSDSVSNRVDLLKNLDPTKTGVAGWGNVTVDDLKVLGIIDHTKTNGADEIVDLDDSINKDKQLSDYAYFQQPRNPFTNVEFLGDPTLVTYKVKSGSDIDFKQLINGDNASDPFNSPGVYDSIIKNLEKEYVLKSTDPVILAKIAAVPVGDEYVPTDLELKVMETQAVENYKDIYKLILVDGNLVIPDDFSYRYINYLIYCTGTVTFKGEATFYNSSVFAKNLIIEANGSDKGVSFYGITTAKARSYVGKGTLSDFSDIDKMIINEYLIKNLDGYSDHIVYKIVQWK